MSVQSYFSQGHYAPDQPVVYWEARLSATKPGGVELTASIQDDPSPPIFPPLRGRTATTVAFQMDQRVAMELYATLGVLGRNMGWLRESEA
jgi:hypothetical protein